jgi:hypothetical protein
VAEHEARSLEKVMPRFRQEGAVAGTGPFIIEGGEAMQQVGGMNVMYHEGSSAVAGAERGASHPSPAAGSRGRAAARMARAPAASNGGAPPAAAPTAAAHRGPAGGGGSTEGSTTHGGLGSGSGGGVVGGGGGPMKIEGELRIPGMADWVAKINGQVRKSGV